MQKFMEVHKQDISSHLPDSVGHEEKEAALSLVPQVWTGFAKHNPHLTGRTSHVVGEELDGRKVVIGVTGADNDAYISSVVGAPRTWVNAMQFLVQKDAWQADEVGTGSIREARWPINVHFVDVGSRHGDGKSFGRSSYFGGHCLID
eukprot:GSA25T00002517001.1